MRLVNLTKQAIRLYDTEGDLVEIPPDARHVGLVSFADHETIRADGHSFSLNVRHVRGVKGMPDPAAGTLYVVPVEIAMTLQRERDDVVYVAEDAAVRLGSGAVQRISHLRRLVTS